MNLAFELARTASVDFFFGPGSGGRGTHDWISLGRVTIE